MEEDARVLGGWGLHSAAEVNDKFTFLFWWTGPHRQKTIGERKVDNCRAFEEATEGKM